MNLHGIVSDAIGTVNPHVQATVRRNTGYTTDDSGERTPTYDEFPIVCQVQPVTFMDLQKMEGLNIQGVRRAIYVSAEVEASIRIDRKGGDMIAFPAGTMPESGLWQASLVLEVWPDWRKVAITLQNSAPT